MVGADVCRSAEIAVTKPLLNHKPKSLSIDRLQAILNAYKHDVIAEARCTRVRQLEIYAEICYIDNTAAQYNPWRYWVDQKLQEKRETEMAITVNIYYTGEGTNAREFAKEMVSGGTAEKIRAEEGNLRYEYFFPMEDEHTVLLIDSWEDQAAIDAHHHSPMMNTIMTLREKYDLHMKVERYITDETGVPKSDKAFVRT